jgi:Sugar (and other) transporter
MTGRRIIALVSTTLLTIFLYLIGALTKLYGTSNDRPGIYGTVACMFLFMGSYSIGWTPLCYLYPPEVLNYRLRPQGMGVNTWTYFSFGLAFVFAFPYALDAIGWKVYMMNASWNVLLLLFIYFQWVETKGKTLEEIDALFKDSISIDSVEIGLSEKEIADIEVTKVEPED